MVLVIAGARMRETRRRIGVEHNCSRGVFFGLVVE